MNQMARRTLWAVGIAVGLSSVAGTLAAAELKIGYVRLTDVFDAYQRTKASEAALEQKGKQKESELQGRLAELQKMRQNLELLADAAREAKAREVEQRADELQRFRRDTARDLQRERDAAAKEILKDIESAVADAAKAAGYTLVLDERSLLYGQPADNLTDAVLKLLNGRYKKP